MVAIDLAEILEAEATVILQALRTAIPVRGFA